MTAASTVGLPASRLALLIGQNVEDYSDFGADLAKRDVVLGLVRRNRGRERVTEPGEDGPGIVVIVSKSPMPNVYGSVISHELVHLLQDQWTGWQLHDWLRDASTTDEQEAVRWVVEGDATLNELYEWESPLQEALADIRWGPLMNSEFELWQRAVDSLTPQSSSSVFAAYEQGFDVMGAVRAEGGQEAVDALLLDPPESTEQLMDLEKLRSGELPLELVDLGRLERDLLRGDDWEPPIFDRMGAQWLNSLIAATTSDPDVALRVAQGWGSDQMGLWESQDRALELVIWQVVFDSRHDHDVGVAGLRFWFNAHSDFEATPVGRDLLVWDGPTGSARLIGGPTAVWLVASNHSAIADYVTDGIRSRVWTNYWALD